MTGDAATPLTGDAVVIDLREPVVRRRYVRGQARQGALEDLGRYRNAHTYPAGPRPDDEDDDVAAPAISAAPSPTAPAPMALDEPTRAVVRRVRLRSVAKVAVGAYLSALAIVLIAGAVLWNVADRAGWITNWTSFLVDIGFVDATFEGGVVLRASVLAGLILVATGVFLTVIGAAVYNHLSALFGGLEVTLTASRSRRD